MRRPATLGWRALAFAGAFVGLGVSATASVNVGLKASFDSPPLLVELLETAAEENATSYYPLLDRIAEGYFDGSTDNDEQLYNSFLKLLREDGHISTPDSLSSFQFSLSIHSTAPRIEAHYQFYRGTVAPVLTNPEENDLEAWVARDGKQYIDGDFSGSSHSVLGQSQYAWASKAAPELPFDRTYGHSAASETLILYADVASPSFRQVYKSLKDLVSSERDSKFAYRLRYKPGRNAKAERLTVHGYGVELALKKTDYIVIDDREAGETTDSNTPKTSKKGLENEEEPDLKPLSASDLRSLGLKTGSYVASSDNKLETLLKLSQDFPKHSAAISAHNVTDSFRTEWNSNKDFGIRGGSNVLWINGKQMDPRKMDAFSLASHLRKERQFVQRFRDLGISGKDAISILAHEAISSSQGNENVQRYDWRDQKEGGNVVMWLNNIVKDKRYAEWPTAISSFIRMTYPGQLPIARRSAHLCVAPIDFSKADHVEIVSEHFRTLIKRKVPIEFGVVPMTNSKAAMDQAAVVYHLQDTYGLVAAFDYLEHSLTLKSLLEPNQKIYDTVTSERSPRKEKASKTLQEVLEDTLIANRLSSATTYLKRLGVDETDAPIFGNGVPFSRDQHWLQDLSQRISVDMREIQQGVVQDELTDDSHIPDLWLAKASARRNRFITPEDDKDVKLVDLHLIYSKHRLAMSKAPSVPATQVSTTTYAAHLIVIGDFGTRIGSRLMYDAMRFREEHPELDLVFLYNPEHVETPEEIAHKVLEIFGSEPHADFINTWADASYSPETEQNALLENFVKKVGDGAFVPLRALEDFGLTPGQRAVVLSGRVVGPIPEDTEFPQSDFETLLQYELEKRIKPADNAVRAQGLSQKVKTPLATAKISGTIAMSIVPDTPSGIFADFPNERMKLWEEWDSEHTAIKIGDIDNALVQVVASLDPASEAAQRWTPILKVLSELEGVHTRIFLNPVDNLSELPVKRFYRYVLKSKPSFDASGAIVGSSANFEGLPAEALLTMGMDVPAPWLVAPKDSVHDLDNIKLSSHPRDSVIEATYALENILIEGHSRDVTTQRVPRGAQVMIGTEQEPRQADTIIMANLGYFQFKANPGFYSIALLPGRSQEIFKIDSLGAQGLTEKQTESEATEIAMTSFQGVTLFPKLSRRPGMEEEDVLSVPKSSIEEMAEQGTVLAEQVLLKAGLPGDKAAAYLSKGLKFGSDILSKTGLSGSQPASRHAEINIFSVASGHLYERMLNIMMVSVMRHTKHTVKFWFIEQFLSPSFKSFLPTLAAEYNFRYELVTYKWPHWLRAQKEKQREIWGYKILFLDVLFPQDLDRVIFVDADQIVRTDMRQLATLDLQGAPYGFTPMCDSRTSMDGFRFWKQGYWAKALGGKPYHISALYAVDLARFRALAAGDRLRGQYHQLSADPNSLANLDQDLPNSMQAVLPITSLSQEWLWCETWCADEELSKAKTIDLCNNPETKEPKLERARRQVPEWTVYDEEIAALARRNKGGEAEGAEYVVAGQQEGGKKEGAAKGRGETLEENKKNGHDEL